MRDLYRDGHGFRDTWTRPEKATPVRRYILSGGQCVTCSQHMASEMMPPHDASPKCESGKRNHCSCDVCF